MMHRCNTEKDDQPDRKKGDDYILEPRASYLPVHNRLAEKSGVSDATIVRSQADRMRESGLKVISAQIRLAMENDHDEIKRRRS